ncbi:MAG: hypothetical protein KC643_31355, partial [Nitrospira sp.]|nr:hypothetical protein [Nitrospira sp.]
MKSFSFKSISPVELTFMILAILCWNASISMGKEDLPGQSAGLDHTVQSQSSGCVPIPFNKAWVIEDKNQGAHLLIVQGWAKGLTQNAKFSPVQYVMQPD